MFKNYLKTALRNLLREKSSTLINIAGLTLGITSSLILFLMVTYHAGFDSFQSKGDRIYRIVDQSNGNNGVNYQAGVPTLLPDAFRLDFPEAEEVVFTSYRSGTVVLVPQKNAVPKKYLEKKGVVYTEPSFFKIFDRAVIAGDPVAGLKAPNEAVISRSLAKKYFNNEDALGELVRFENNDFKITAVVEDSPSNTDLPFDLFLSYATIKKTNEESGWDSMWSDEQCYFLLRENESIEKVKARMASFTIKYLGSDDPDKTLFFAQPLHEIHFDSRFDIYSESKAPKAMLLALGVIALALIVTACINFINLATAEAIKRSKEVGIRKTLGSSRYQLIAQFLGETTLVTLFSILLSLALAQFALTLINPFLDVNLTLDFSGNRYLGIFIAGIAVAVSLLSGLYPAFVVSGFRPAMVLKNKINDRNSSSYVLRRILVVTQFMISQLLIIITIVIIAQMDYYGKKDLGFHKDAVIVVPIPESKDKLNASKARTLRDEMMHVSGVTNASLSNTPPSSQNVSGTIFSLKGDDQIYSTQIKQVDGNYIDLFHLKLVAGHNVQDLDTATGFVVNEKFAHTAGFEKPADLLGRIVRVWGKELPVVGVVKDFHTVSLQGRIEPTAMFNRLSGYETLSLKVDMAQANDIIHKLESKWEAAYPEDLFGYEFLDQSIQHFYDGVQRWSIMLTAFTSLAIVIGCLGLFGLATFMANQKTKEIGVRKVMGASVESIVLMFSKEYVKLIIIGFALAAPLAWMAMNAFLKQFEYKEEMGPGVFILGLVITMLIAVITVSYKSIKAAVVNPVQSLRYE